MARTHTVLAGEHLSGIAQRYGFENFEIIWNHPDNEHLRKMRESPHVLYAGDKLAIPDGAPKVFTAATGQSHRFTVHLSQLKLRVRLLDSLGDPLAGEDCELDVAGETRAVHTDGDGVLEAMIPSDAREATVRAEGLTYVLEVGHLDPIDTAEGVAARLSNLGYRYADPDLIAEERDGAHFALALFLDVERIDPSSERFDAFLEKLRTKHGV